MPITIDFREKYKDLIDDSIEKIRLTALNDGDDVPFFDVQQNIPEKYRRKFVTTPDGFVSKYCEEY